MVYMVYTWNPLNKTFLDANIRHLFHLIQRMVYLPMFGLLFVKSVCKYTDGSYVYNLVFTHLNLPLTPLSPLVRGVFWPSTAGRPDMHLSN